MTIEKNDYALVIGINHYRSLTPLKNALRDADAFEKWLLDSNSGGGLLKENCHKILSEENSGRPVNAEIDDAFETIIEKLKISPARRFYFYFSGHGMAASMLKAYLCLPKWSCLRRRMALDSEDYWLMLCQTGLCEQVVCLFDCCRIYKPNIGGLPSSLGVARPNKNAARTRLFLAFASEYMCSAFEDSAGDGHGFFTRALLSGLRGGACYESGGASARRLQIFLQSETKRLAKLAGENQTPIVFNGFCAKDDPVFGSAKPPGTTNKLVYVVRVSNASNRKVVLIDPNADETPWDGSQPWRLELAKGLHILEDNNGKVLRLPRDITQGEIHVSF